MFVGRYSLSASLLAVALSVVPAVGEQRPPDRRVGTPAPAFEIQTLDGEKVSLELLAGKIVLFDFWATWCKPCLMANPGLEAMSERLKDQPFVVVAISVDRDRGAWEKYVREHRTAWHHFLDEKKVIVNKYGVSGYPTYMLVDHEGTIRYVRMGWSPNFLDELEREANTLIKAIRR